MIDQQYAHLLDELCLEAGITDSTALHNSGMIVVNDVLFTLMHATHIDDDTVLVCTEFGTLPKNDECVVLQRILISNLFMYGNAAAPRFTYDPEHNRVLLLSRFSISGCTGAWILEAFHEFSRYVQLWQRTYFATDTEPPPADIAPEAPQVNTPNRHARHHGTPSFRHTANGAPILLKRSR